jgi:threonine dehydrogenase-like Zn-dependent dehydrogenase
MNAVLDQHIASVTGGDSGLGAATAVEFAREGADVALTYLHDEQGAAQTARALVLGCGAVGQFAITSAMLRGADHVRAVDCQPDRLEMARTQGRRSSTSVVKIRSRLCAI